GPYLNLATSPPSPGQAGSGINIGHIEGGIHNSTLSGRDVQQTYHVTVQGGLTMGDQFNMTGDFRGAIVNIKSTLENVTQTVNASTGGDPSAKVELQQLLKQLSETLQQVPPEHA